MKKSPPLKPCPFCLAEEPILEVLTDLQLLNCTECCNGEDFSVVCNVHTGGCGASGGYGPTTEKAIARWNKRGEEEPHG